MSIALCMCRLFAFYFLGFRAAEFVFQWNLGTAYVGRINNDRNAFALNSCSTTATSTKAYTWWSVCPASRYYRTPNPNLPGNWSFPLWGGNFPKIHQGSLIFGTFRKSPPNIIDLSQLDSCKQIQYFPKVVNTLGGSNRTNIFVFQNTLPARTTCSPYLRTSGYVY